MLAVSLAVARLLFEPSSPTTKVAEDAVLLIQRINANLGCPPGSGPDAGVDAGIDAGADAGIDPGCEPIIGDAVSMVLRPRFETPALGARFAMLFVTPSRPIVEIVDDPFPALAALTAPKTEVHVTEIPDASLGEQCQQGGCGFSAPTSAPSFDPPTLGDGGLGDGAPVIEPVGPYEIVRVQPADLTELQALLTSFNYRVQPQDLAALAPYIAAGYTVVAVRVAVGETGTGLAPISMTWAGTQLQLPLALGDQGAGGLTAYIAASGRYDLPGAEVAFAKFVVSGETSFVTRNELHALDSTSPATDPVAAPITGSPEVEIINVVEQTRRVPVNNCVGDVDVGCCDSGGPRGDFGVLALGVLLVLRRKRLSASRR